MIKKYKENITFRQFFWITIAYFAAHWFLLVATGRWWDDWVYADKNWDYLYEVMRQSSLPLSAIADGSNWLFPDGFYRVIVFFWYYLSTYLFYKLLNKIVFGGEEVCFWVTLLFAVAPVFDARILWIMYPYAVGMPLLFGGFNLAIKKEVGSKKSKVIRRICSLFILMLAYCFLQSAMLLVIPLVAYLCYLDLHEDWNWRNARQNSKKIIKTLICYVDYLIEPLLWYFGDKRLFPGYGEYGGVYYISWDTLLNTIIHSPQNAFMTLTHILLNYWNVLSDMRIKILVFIFVVANIIILFIHDILRKDDNCIKNSGFIKDCMMFLLGGMVFFLTFFPYCVKRNSYLGVIYLDGRDTVLLGFGLAVIIYFGINIFFNKKITKPLLICFTILGIIHFNFVYLDWQESYYQQVQLQHEIAQNDEIRNNDTFLIMYKGDMICSNFYQTNGNSWEATGEETRYYMPGVASLVGLIDMNDDTWFLNAYGMNEYEYGEKIVDGIIFVDYTDIGRRTILKQKFNEIFNYPAFDKWIDDIKNIKYVPITKEESDDMIKKCIDGELTDQMIYDMYY